MRQKTLRITKPIIPSVATPVIDLITTVSSKIKQVDQRDDSPSGAFTHDKSAISAKIGPALKKKKWTV